MQSTLSLSFSSSSTIPRSNYFAPSAASYASVPSTLRFCGLRREAFRLTSSNRLQLRSTTTAPPHRLGYNVVVSATAGTANGTPPLNSFDYDLIIIGAGVGGHGAALHAVEKGLKTAVIEGDVVGGTCVNRGCVPSKALLAVSGRMRELQSEHHMKALGLQVQAAGYDRQAVADHANNLATKIRGNLTNSMKALGVDILTGAATILGPQKVKYGKDNIVTGKNVIIATGSVPFVPKGIEVDGKTVITSDHALKLETVPDWIAIVGSGYIGLEFSDVYTALGSEVTFVEALDQLMPGFDPEIGKLAQRVLINPRNIDYHTGVFATKITPARDGKPVTIELTDAKTKEHKETLEVDAALIATGRAPYTQGLGLENLIYRPDNGEILGVHIFGLHAADLIHEASNAIALGTRIQDLKLAVHAHPTLSEVLDELYKAAKAHVVPNILWAENDDLVPEHVSSPGKMWESRSLIGIRPDDKRKTYWRKILEFAVFWFLEPIVELSGQKFLGLGHVAKHEGNSETESWVS
ncbi:hypothetical protein ACFE04_011945 [Oxalis oulophora]